MWHTTAAQALAAVKAAGAPQLTTERVIQSQGSAAPLALDDVYNATRAAADIYNAEPALGFYCLYRARPGQAPPRPDCANVSATAAAHAAALLALGIDYVAVDVTNWPKADVGGSTDVAVLRPTEVLFEEWRALRDRGVPTPRIAVWPCSPAGGTTCGDRATIVGIRLISFTWGVRYRRWYALTALPSGDVAPTVLAYVLVKNRYEVQVDLSGLVRDLPRDVDRLWLWAYDHAETVWRPVRAITMRTPCY